MTTIALFHSVLGVRPGVHAAADLLRSHGHDVHIVDQYDGQVFDDYTEASAFAEERGFPALMQQALAAVADLPGGFVAMGISNGGGMAEFVATQRPDVAGVVLQSGVIDLAMLGDAPWPSGVPVQVHYTVDDPLRREEWVQAAIASVTEAGGAVELYDYPGAGHLFADPSMPADYQPAEAALFWPRVLEFVANAGEAGQGSRPPM